MRRMLRMLAVTVVVVAGWLAPAPRALAANLDTTADRVIGQADFAHGAANRGNSSPSADSLSFPNGMALDAQGNLYVADADNNRVLEYNAPLTSGMAASRVFGQADFTHGQVNRGNPNPSANSLYVPSGVAFDAQGDLYVADTYNNRALEYDNPLTRDTTADQVFGQADFTHGQVNRGNPNPSANSLNYPSGVTFDGQGNLYVADGLNSRVLEYDDPLTHDASADRVFGQADFIHGAFNRGNISPGANSLGTPAGMALDAQGNLYVADYGNNRVLEYDDPWTHDASADRVFGQADFTHNVANLGNSSPSATSLNSPSGVAVDAQGNLFVADYSNSRVLEYDLPVAHDAPGLAAISPSTVAGGSPDFTLTVTGSGFVLGSVVRWNGSDRPTTYLNSTRLTAAISRGDVASGGPFAVTVFTPSPGGGTSSLLNLTRYARIPFDGQADLEQGQPNFATAQRNNTVLLAAAQLAQPLAAAVDAHTERLFVADAGNSRILSWPDALALANGQPASLVLGQPNLFETGQNDGGLGPTSLSSPNGIAVDAQGNLWVADAGNNRVLEYDAPLASGKAASRVFGQGGSFTSGIANNGGVISANSLWLPTGVAVDAQGDLYVADSQNNRVLEYDDPLAPGGDTTADRVFGQADFSHGLSNRGFGSPAAGRLSFPNSAALDAQGNLYVADSQNNRVLEYNDPLTHDAIADRQFGQVDFTHGAANRGNPEPDEFTLSDPVGVTFDAQGNLHVADALNNRVLEYDNPQFEDAGADHVFGQADFTHNAINRGNSSPSANSLFSPFGVAIDGVGDLLVADTRNNRVLEFDWPAAQVFLPVVLR
jgi:sugar lactone lactonase YvrE